MVLMVLLVNIDGRHPRISTTSSPDIDAALLYDNSANGALMSLNLASNTLGAEGAKHVAEAIKVNVSALRFD